MGRKKKVPVEIIEVAPTTTCECGSVERLPYYGERYVSLSHVISGRRIKGALLRRTRCADCGRMRTDKEYDYRD